MNVSKKIQIAIMIGLFFVSAGLAQIIENPDKPKSLDAGRVIVPREVMKITDESGEFFFKYPYGIKIGPEGLLAVLDNQQILLFDKNGSFVRNYFKKGQGPGEMTQANGFALLKDGRFLVNTANPAKMIWFDEKGNLERELSLPSKYKWARLLEYDETSGIFETDSSFQPKEGAEFVQVPHQLEIWSEKTNEWSSLTKLDCLSFVAHNGGSTSQMTLLAIQAVIVGPALLAVSHTEEYLVKILQIPTGKIVREFRRAYQRNPTPPHGPGYKPGGFNVNGKTYEMPDREYVKDIFSIQAVTGQIWIVTSTVDKKKGLLIDVFDVEGIYRDAFYLQLPEAALKQTGSLRFGPDGKSVFTIETNEDGTKVIKKYLLQ